MGPIQRDRHFFTHKSEYTCTELSWCRKTWKYCRRWFPYTTVKSDDFFKDPHWKERLNHSKRENTTRGLVRRTKKRLQEAEKKIKAMKLLHSQSHCTVELNWSVWTFIEMDISRHWRPHNPQNGLLQKETCKIASRDSIRLKEHFRVNSLWPHDIIRQFTSFLTALSIETSVLELWNEYACTTGFTIRATRSIIMELIQQTGPNIRTNFEFDQTSKDETPKSQCTSRVKHLLVPPAHLTKKKSWTGHTLNPKCTHSLMRWLYAWILRFAIMVAM